MLPSEPPTSLHNTVATAADANPASLPSPQGSQHKTENSPVHTSDLPMQDNPTVKSTGTNQTATSSTEMTDPPQEHTPQNDTVHSTPDLPMQSTTVQSTGTNQTATSSTEMPDLPQEQTSQNTVHTADLPMRRTDSAGVAEVKTEAMPLPTDREAMDDDVVVSGYTAIPVDDDSNSISVVPSRSPVADRSLEPEAPSTVVPCSLCGAKVTAEGEHSMCMFPCGHYYGKSCIRAFFDVDASVQVGYQHSQGAPLFRTKRKKCVKCETTSDYNAVRAIYIDPDELEPTRRQVHLANRIRDAEALKTRLDNKNVGVAATDLQERRSQMLRASNALGTVVEKVNSKIPAKRRLLKKLRLEEDTTEDTPPIDLAAAMNAKLSKRRKIPLPFTDYHTRLAVNAIPNPAGKRHTTKALLYHTNPQYTQSEPPPNTSTLVDLGSESFTHFQTNGNVLDASFHPTNDRIGVICELNGSRSFHCLDPSTLQSSIAISIPPHSVSCSFTSDDNTIHIATPEGVSVYDLRKVTDPAEALSLDSTLLPIQWVEDGVMVGRCGVSLGEMNCLPGPSMMERVVAVGGGCGVSAAVLQKAGADSVKSVSLFEVFKEGSCLKGVLPVLCPALTLPMVAVTTLPAGGGVAWAVYISGTLFAGNTAAPASVVTLCAKRMSPHAMVWGASLTGRSHLPTLCTLSARVLTLHQVGR